MKEKKLRKLFILCLIFVVFLIIITSIDFEEIKAKNNVETGNGNINVSSYQKFDKINYNNLSSDEMDYISSRYSGNVKFTEKGVEVYNESAVSGKLNKIITSTWPSAEIGSIIPIAEYGELDRIEYSENWIEVYIRDAKKSDAKNYLKLLKKYNFTENEQKEDGKYMVLYEIFNEAGDFASIQYVKESKELLIRAEKNN